MSQLEQYANKSIIDQAGQTGSMGIFAIDDDKIVTSTNMKNGAYTVAAQPTAPCLLSVLATAVGSADTMGKVTFVGTDENGTAITEEVIPIADTTVYTTNMFKSVTSATGSGWTIGEGNDTIKIGVADVVAPTGYYFCAIQVLADAVAARQTDKDVLTAALSDYTKLPVVMTIPTRITKIALTSGEAIGFLARSV